MFNILEALALTCLGQSHILVIHENGNGKPKFVRFAIELGFCKIL